MEENLFGFEGENPQTNMDNTANEKQDNGLIEFRGKIDEKIMYEKVKREGKKHGKTGLIVFFIGLLALAFFALIFKDIIKEENFTSMLFGILAVIVVGLLMSLKGFFFSASKSKANKNSNLYIVFDKSCGVLSITPIDNSKKRIYIPFASINGLDEYNTYYEVKYDETHRNKKVAKKQTATFTTKVSSVICQKNLLVNGRHEDFVSLINYLSEKKQIADKMLREKFKRFAVLSIIFSLLGVGLCYPSLNFAGAIFEYISGLFGPLGGGDCASITADVVLILPKLLVSAVLALVGAFCYVAPVPFLFMSFLNWIKQLKVNHKWYVFLAIIIWLVAVAGSVIIYMSVLG